jgi:hypothetical protein
MVTLMVAVHACAPLRLRALSVTAVGWMLIVAGVTMTVHLVELTFVRRINPADVPSFDRLLNFQWPSLLYAADIAAWDLFLGLSLLFAAAVLAGIFGYAVVFPLACLALSRAFAPPAVRPASQAAHTDLKMTLASGHKSHDLATLRP